MRNKHIKHLHFTVVFQTRFSLNLAPFQLFIPMVIDYFLFFYKLLFELDDIILIDLVCKRSRRAVSSFHYGT